MKLVRIRSKEERTGLAGKMMKLFLDAEFKVLFSNWVVMSSSHRQIVQQESRSGLETDLGIVRKLITSPRENTRVGRENK